MKTKLRNPVLYVIYKIKIVKDTIEKKNKVISVFYGIESDHKKVQELIEDEGWSAMVVDKDFTTTEGQYIWLGE